MDFTTCIKNIREHYLPCTQGNPCINTLFIGESVPAPSKKHIPCEKIRFFYNKNTDLFNGTKEAFSSALSNKPWENDEEFLIFFKQNGYYLIDLCEESANKIEGANRKIIRKMYRKNGEIKLKEEILKYRPKNIVVMMMGIQTNVDSALAQIPPDEYRCDNKISGLPFPSRRFPKNRKKFIQNLSDFLKTQSHQ